jgi:hypothetical protein
MGTGLEPHQARAAESHAPPIRVPLVLRNGELKLSIDPDGSVRHLESLAEGRLLFGREQLHIYRRQGGALVQAPKHEWRISSTIAGASFTSRPFDSIEVSLSVRLLRARSSGYSRRVSLRNLSSSPAKVHLVALADPTTAHFRDRSYGWGSIGVNAFNRTSHVAIDEVVEPSSSRVIGARPAPKILYMTSDKLKALDLIERGELPEQTAGMSGQVIVLAEHEFDLQPGGTAEVSYVSLYNSSKLEVALGDLGSFFEAGAVEEFGGPWFACSSPHVTSGFVWALGGLEGVELERDQLDRLESLRGLAFVSPESAKAIIETSRTSLTGAGSLPHSLDLRRPGVLETSIFLDGASRLLLLSGDKKYARSVFPALRRAANFLVECAHDGVIKLDPSLPQGWRRRIGKGYPAGEIPEVSLSVAGALAQAASVASRIGRAQESAKYREKSIVITASVRKRLVDEKGFLALSLDDAGRLRSEETVDQAVASYRHRFDKAVSASLVHRMLERDFDTGLGPRTLPSSNRLIFNPSYGEGQLGGYWTRAALAHTVLAYVSGFGGTGSLELEAIGKMASSDYARYGSAPGDFPYWIDPGKREARSQGSDPVAAARYVEAMVAGDLGISPGPNGVVLDPSVSSSLKWVAGGDLLPERRLHAFVGRAGGRAFSFVCGASPQGANDMEFAGAEKAGAEDSRISAVSLFGPGQVVCVGNSSEASVRTLVRFGPRDPGLSKKLTAGLEELDAQTGSWRKVSAIKVLPSMSFELSLGAGEWKVFKVSS